MNAPFSPTFVIMMLLCYNLVSVLADLNCKNKKFKEENNFAQITRKRIHSKQELSYVI